jgi:hypothetical protein
MAYPRPGIAWVFQSLVFVMLPAGVGAPDGGGGELAVAALGISVGKWVGAGAVLQAAANVNAQPSTRSRRQGTNNVEMCRR